MTDRSTDWDPTCIVVVSGLPGELSTPDSDGPVYPATTLPFVKILRSAGYPVRLETPDRVREVSHHAADLWLPIVDFGLQVLAGGAGNVLADVLMRVFGASTRGRTTAHIRWNVQGPDGSVHEFAFDGDGETAIDAARSFERSLGYGDGARG
ncbi:hypothetical protein ABIC47_003485 [Leifsonia sp. 563]|uniref:hypothetical protein n=1 Tax=Leifsonia sp. 563 TaxID=3156412 RepID=UPI00339739F9